ncbi:uncharacterized protein LOC123294073 [Chrysoperla carnea]|uniref:uncharacterized protein LOC123294073 n=1 Tax=Chrysoperla carnea TaxID=189513 RepID=UPI001D0999D0|nr:uncharacterized protein LOC123294073 [Chrysoperla carnea]
MKFFILAVFVLIAAHSTQCDEQKPKEKELSKGKNDKRSIYGELDLGYPIHESIDNQLEISHDHHLNFEPIQDSILIEPAGIQFDQIGSAPVSDEDSVVVESADARASSNGQFLIPARNLNLNQGLLVQLPPTLNTLNSGIPRTQVQIQRSIEIAVPQPSLEGWSSQEIPIVLRNLPPSLQRANSW